MTLGERCDEIIRLIDEAVGSDSLPASHLLRSVDEPVVGRAGLWKRGPGRGAAEVRTLRSKAAPR